MAGGSSTFAKNRRVIRVRVPLDLHAVARVRSLLALAVREAIGALAPSDKFDRSMHRTLKGLENGDYALTVDGRIIRDADAVVVCEDTADVRFYLKRIVAEH